MTKTEPNAVALIAALVAVVDAYRRMANDACQDRDVFAVRNFVNKAIAAENEIRKTQMRYTTK